MVRTRTEEREVREESPAILCPVGRDDMDHGERLRDDIANMQQANANWQRQLGGDMNDFARQQSEVAHPAVRMFQHEGR